jgi:hypothetical protein
MSAPTPCTTDTRYIRYSISRSFVLVSSVRTCNLACSGGCLQLQGTGCHCFFFVPYGQSQVVRTRGSQVGLEPRSTLVTWAPSTCCRSSVIGASTCLADVEIRASPDGACHATPASAKDRIGPVVRVRRKGGNCKNNANDCCCCCCILQ